MVRRQLGLRWLPWPLILSSLPFPPAAFRAGQSMRWRQLVQERYRFLRLLSSTSTPAGQVFPFQCWNNGLVLVKGLKQAGSNLIALFVCEGPTSCESKQLVQTTCPNTGRHTLQSCRPRLRSSTGSQQATAPAGKRQGTHCQAGLRRDKPGVVWRLVTNLVSGAHDREWHGNQRAAACVRIFHPCVLLSPMQLG